MQYLRRSVAFFFALQQMKLDFATQAVNSYNNIFDRMCEDDPGLRVLLTRVVRAKGILLPFINHKEKVFRCITDVDNVLCKHPLFGASLTQLMLVSANEVLKLSDRFIRNEWVQEDRESEVHFMFSLLSLVKSSPETFCEKDNNVKLDVNFVEDEAFLVLKEYHDDFGRDIICDFYDLAFQPLNTQIKRT